MHHVGNAIHENVNHDLAEERTGECDNSDLAERDSDIEDDDDDDDIADDKTNDENYMEMFESTDFYNKNSEAVGK